MSVLPREYHDFIAVEVRVNLGDTFVQELMLELSQCFIYLMLLAREYIKPYVIK